MRWALALAVLTVLATAGGAAASGGVRIYAIGVKSAPVVTSADIIRSSVQAYSTSGQSGVAFTFTEAGATKFLLLTRAVAHRGARLHRFTEFAIEVDGHVYSRPFINYHRNPNGLPSPSAELVTTSLAVAQRLAALMRAH
jgi:preprotein translocase subunit SecD